MKDKVKIIGSVLIGCLFLFVAFGSGDYTSSEEELKKTEVCCCCDGGHRVVYYESKKGVGGFSTGTDYSKPEPCPCCGAMKGDYENAKLNKAESLDLKKTSGHCQ